MKHLVLILTFCILALSACLPVNGLPSTLQPQDLIGTIVAQTLTANATGTMAASTNTLVPNTPTPVPPTSTPVPPTLTFTSTWTPTYTLPIETPDQFIRQYYYNINIANYPYTWSLLDLNFVTTMNNLGLGGYAGYVRFWNSMHSVRVLNVVVVFQCNGCVVVNVTARFRYTNGAVITVTDTYILVYDEFRNTWLFDSSLTPSSTPSLTPTSTPVHSPTPTSSRTGSPTPSITITNTATQTGTATPSETPSETSTL
jgi:hypothetical protein